MKTRGEYWILNSTSSVGFQLPDNLTISSGARSRNYSSTKCCSLYNRKNRSTMMKDSGEEEGFSVFNPFPLTGRQYI